MKTLLIGLDAACWSFLDPLLAQGNLPHLEKLMASGSWGTLTSTMPALTPAAWSSIITGKNPGKHGIFDLTLRRHGSYEFGPVSASARQGTPFWKRLNTAGIRVGLVNVPFSYPPDEVNGFVVTGFGAPGSAANLAYPPEAMAWIRDRFPDFEPSVAAELLFSNDHDAIYAAEAAHQANFIDIALGLADRIPVDVLAINLMLLDHANHKMPDMARVEQAICRLDQDMGRLIEGFRPDTVLAISDHGARRVKGDFLLHAWLRDEGLVVQQPRPSSERSDVLNWILNQWLETHQGWSGVIEKGTRRILRWGVPRLPSGLARRFWQQLEQDIPFARAEVELSDVLDYSRSRIYPGAAYSGVLYVNRVGREPSGIVSPEEEADLVVDLRRKLLALVDPDSKSPLFSDVYLGTDLYPDALVVETPSLVIDFYNSDWNILSSYRRGTGVEQTYGRYFVANTKDFGHHSRDGIFAFSGPMFAKAGMVTGNGDLVDIPATLLHLYGVPVPEDWDGRSMTDLMTPEFLMDHPLQTQPGDPVTAVFTGKAFEPDESEQILDHLRALGYVS